MPLYDYKCEKCEAVFEVRQNFSDPLLTEHEGCGGKVTRLISVPALQFKGSGFYITDYKGGKSASSGVAKNESKSEAPAKSESPAPAPASTDTKK